MTSPKEVQNLGKANTIRFSGQRIRISLAPGSGLWTLRGVPSLPQTCLSLGSPAHAALQGRSPILRNQGGGTLPFRPVHSEPVAAAALMTLSHLWDTCPFLKSNMFKAFLLCIPLASLSLTPGPLVPPGSVFDGILPSLPSFCRDAD